MQSINNLTFPIRDIASLPIPNDRANNGFCQTTLTVRKVLFPARSIGRFAIDRLLLVMVLEPRVRGSMTVDGRLQQFSFDHSSIVAVPRGRPLEVNLERPACLLLVEISHCLENEVFSEVAETNDCVYHFRGNKVIDDPLVAAAMVAFLKTTDIRTLASVLETEAAARLILLRIASRYSKKVAIKPNGANKLPNPWLRKTLDLIEQNLERRITAAVLAQGSAWGVAHFSRLFQGAMGVTIHQYIIGRRVEKARHLLSETTISLSAIAIACGFHDQNHFTKFFGREAGITPAAFRRASQ